MPILTTYTKADFDRWYASGDWKGETFWQKALDAATRHPEKIALVQGERRVSWKEFTQRTERLALGLKAQGIGQGDVASVQLPNSIELAMIILALARIEAIYNPLNPGYRRHEVELITNLVRSRAVFCPGEYGGFDYLSLHNEILAKAERPVCRILVGENPPSGWLTFNEVEKAGDRPVKNTLKAPDPDAVFLLGSTSGTTGNPKIYIHTAQTQLQEAVQMNTTLGVKDDAVFLCMAPMTHRGAMMFGFFTTIAAGATLVLADKYDPALVLDLFEQEKITHFMAIPTQIVDLLNLYDKAPRDAGSVRLSVMAGAPVGEVLVERFLKTWPRCAPVTGYGMSECGYCTLTRPSDPKEKLYTSGRPALNMEVEIRSEKGEPLPAGETGEIHIRGPFVCGGYFDNQRATSDAIDAGGWLSSGDLGFLDEEGYLHPVGRLKHVIIRGGLKIHAEEIEFLLSQHPAVAGAIVVGLPDERLGERGCACIVCRQGSSFDLAELRRFFEEKGVAKFQWPEFIVSFREFPRNPVGKIDRRAVLEEAREKAGAQVLSRWKGEK